MCVASLTLIFTRSVGALQPTRLLGRVGSKFNWPSEDQCQRSHSKWVFSCDQAALWMVLLLAKITITCQNYHFGKYVGWSCLSVNTCQNYILASMLLSSFVRVFVCLFVVLTHHISRTNYQIITKLNTDMSNCCGKIPIIFLGQRLNN